VRLDGVTATQAVLDDFPAAAALAAPLLALIDGNGNGVIDTPLESGLLLDGFFSPTAGLGSLRGHIAREFRREEIYGFGLNYVFTGMKPDSFLDQLVLRYEMAYTPNKVAYAKFGVATSRKWKDKEEKLFLDCIAWGKTGELIHEHLRKGDPIFFEGRLSFSQWTNKEGQKRSKIEAVVENFQFVGSKQRSEPAEPRETRAGVDDDGPPATEPDIPF